LLTLKIMLHHESLHLQRALTIMTLLLSACTSKQPYQPSYTPKYVPTPYVGYKAPSAKKDYPPISYEDLLRFESNCSYRLEQMDYLEDQLRKKTFYRVDGVEGNEFPNKISKKYFALVRYRIWNLRLGCRGSKVDQATQMGLLRKSIPNQPPESNSRCYVEDIFESTIRTGEKTNQGDSMVSKRREICTNFPLLTDSKAIRIGDVVDPDRDLEKNIAYIPSLRKFDGNIYQLVSKTEIHLDGVVRFTVVLLWVSNKGWVVVDKF